MKQKNDILTKVARNDGMTVPDGFFDDFAAGMVAMLPENPEAERKAVIVKPRTLWGTVRPYVYMAAMFAGIWCMLKMFTMLSPGTVDLSVENNRILTEALGDDNFVYDYFLDDIDDGDIYDEIYGENQL